MISSGLLVTPWCCFVLVLLTPALLCLFTLKTVNLSLLLVCVFLIPPCVCTVTTSQFTKSETVCDMHEQQRLLAQVKRPGVFFIDLKSHFICVSQRLNVIEHAQIS